MPILPVPQERLIEVYNQNNTYTVLEEDNLKDQSNNEIYELANKISDKTPFHINFLPRFPFGIYETFPGEIFLRISDYIKNHNIGPQYFVSNYGRIYDVEKKNI